jgi:hypothetical protein
VDVSTTTKKQMYISKRDNLYEPPPTECMVYTFGDLQKLYPDDKIPPIPFGFEQFTSFPDLYARTYCLECHGTQIKPDDWPH